jgi:tRNA pseudouridine13 synthase
MDRVSEAHWLSFDDLPRVIGEPPVRGLMRARPEDFRVDEIPVFEPDGVGEHALLQVRKTSANTEWVARRLASHARVPVSSVGYAGLKDRHAVTTQWFSVQIGAKADPDWRAFEADGVELLYSTRHRRKIRRGALRGNRFRIRIREVDVREDWAEQRVGLIRKQGVPNYFGPQRFGSGEGNLYAADALFAGGSRLAPRHLRGLWISAARSQLFNEVLALRVERGDWNRPLRGDRLQLEGSRSHFLAEIVDEDIRNRVADFDLHPTGPLQGAGEGPCADEPARMEQSVMKRFPAWAAGLKGEGLRQERRSLRLSVPDLSIRRGRDFLVLEFQLPAGAYATAVLREIVDWSEPARNNKT